MLHGAHIADRVTLIAIVANTPQAVVRVVNNKEVWHEHAACIEPNWSFLYFSRDEVTSQLYKLVYCRYTANETCATCGKPL